MSRKGARSGWRFNGHSVEQVTITDWECGECSKCGRRWRYGNYVVGWQEIRGVTKGLWCCVCGERHPLTSCVHGHVEDWS